MNLQLPWLPSSLSHGGESVGLIEREERESERGKGRMREKGEKERRREIKCVIDNVSTWYEIGRKSYKQMADIPLSVE